MKCLLLTFSLMMFAVQASGTTWNSYLKNREAMKKYELKSYNQAFKEILGALQDDPMNPYLHMNLGRIFEANEEFDKAEKAYRSALQIIPEDSPLHFQALFNVASAQGAQKHIDEALETYQACLEIDPDSKEVKNNIELLTQGGGQGGGEGEGESEDSKDEKDQQQKKQQQKDSGEDKKEKKKNKPKPFDSKDLTQQDVKKILDEIKNQEQAIRAQEYDKGAKEGTKGKDW